MTVTSQLKALALTSFQHYTKTSLLLWQRKEASNNNYSNINNNKT